MADNTHNPFMSALNADGLTFSGDTGAADIVPVVFTGTNMGVYFNAIKVSNAEAVTWSISRETVGSYAMGSPDPFTFAQGKRVIVGSLVLTQWDRHALLEQVFQLTKRNIRTYGDLWTQSFNKANPLAGAVTVSVNQTLINLDNNSLLGVEGSTPSVKQSVTPSISVLRGMSGTDLAVRLALAAQQTIQTIGLQPFDYSDLLPPFDITLVGTAETGAVSACQIQGLKITQETAGITMNDIGTSVGMAFVCRRITPWRPLKVTLS